MKELPDMELLRYFTEHYYPKTEVTYRLPLSCRIDEFWPKLLEYRKRDACILPLKSWDGHAYWYANTSALLENGDRFAEIARSSAVAALPQSAHDEGIIDEAYYSSAIEGAYSTRQRAQAFIASGAPPKDRSEQMILNNYSALRFIVEHLDAPIGEAVILEIARILTDGTLDDGARHGYRDADVRVVSGRQEVVYVAPNAKYIRPMMDDLLAFIGDMSIHPIIKACAAHLYFVTIHPLFDGNGRTARALSYMLLLQAGYSFIRQFPISGLLAHGRAQYYKAIRHCQDAENGYDFTYFMEYYTAMLVQSAAGMREKMRQNAKLERLASAIGASDTPRLLEGAKWLVRDGIDTITAEKWRNKFKVSFETARQDLLKLESFGFVSKRTVGRKIFFDIPKET